mgnify:CR=1 FL=1
MPQKIQGSQILNLPAVRHNSTTKTPQDDIRVEYGWGAMTFGSTTSSISETVTFNTPFTERPIVMIAFGGDQPSGIEALGSGGNLIHLGVSAKAHSVALNSFVAHVFNTAGGNFNSGNIVYYHWIAIGK